MSGAANPDKQCETCRLWRPGNPGECCSKARGYTGTLTYANWGALCRHYVAIAAKERP